MERVVLANGNLYIDGKAEILLCSSFFYFRMPSEYWRLRMRQLKQSGYNAIDVYFPWNYHETSPGIWDFSGEKDVSRFLTMAREENLYVVARPGPYICSEWDGGGIPAWVHRYDEVRQFDPGYLSMVKEWMDRVLPIIHRFELGQEGSIVLLQLENELDLFPCRHAHRYMEAIRDITDTYGIEIPYVACVAGKGDVDAATGSVERIVPTFNIYPPFSEPSIEEKMEIIQKRILMPKGMPLLATETEREHNFMRRELASGVRLISPYCQMATTNFDCRNGISSWSSTPEKRIVYISNDYDMNAMLKADGSVTKEYLEARLLRNFFSTMGEKVSAGLPFQEHTIQVRTDFQTNYEGLHAMSLAGGGYMLCLPNLSREQGCAEVTYGHHQFSLQVEGDTTRLLLFEVNMEAWGYPEVTIVWTAADIAWIARGEMVIYGEGDGICLAYDGNEHILLGGEELTIHGKPLRIRRMSREQAARSASPFLEAFDGAVSPAWKTQPIQPVSAAAVEPLAASQSGEIRAMEDIGVYDGRVVYEFDVPECKELILKNAADIAALWVNDAHVRTWISDASMQRLPVQGGRVRLRCEIWGHTCFDENYNPLLRMTSLRGLQGAYAVMEELPIHNNWHFAADQGEFSEYVTPVWSALPCLTDFGTLIPKGVTLSGMFRREVRMPLTGDKRFLSLQGITMQAAVYVDGKLAGVVDRTDPIVDITTSTQAGRMSELVIRVRADSAESLPGKLTLLAVQEIRMAQIGVQSVKEAARKHPMQDCAPSLPLSLGSGEAIRLNLSVLPEEDKEKWLRPVGHEIMVTISNHGHILGRLMPDSDIHALFRAGDPNRVWMPREWLREDADVQVLVEALKKGAELTSLQVDYR